MARFVLVLILVHFTYYQQTHGIHVLFDRFEQSVGQDIMLMDLRVRKYNRTMTTLNGTVYLYQEASDDFQVRYYK